MDFKLPELGEGVYEAELVAWKVQPGDEVRRGDVLAEVITDKANMEVPSPFAGTITSLAAQPGDEVAVGQAILGYEPAGKAASDPETQPGMAPDEAGSDDNSPTEDVTPESVTADSRENGRRRETGRTPTPVGKPAEPARSADVAELPAASPSVRHMARELGIDLTQISGSGPGGRILVEDLSRKVESKVESQQVVAETIPAPTKTPAPQSQPSPTQQAKEATLLSGAVSAGQPGSSGKVSDAFGIAGTRIPMRGVRKMIAEHMVASKRTSPHYSYVDECDFSEMVRLRAALKDTFAERGVKLTYLAFMVHAVARALAEVPIVNSSLDEEAGEIVLHAQRHVGVAAATPAGLIVPVIRDADQKSLATIAAEVERLSAAARAGQAERADLRGGTFTVTSIGNIGGLISTPILNQPQVGILGVGKVVRRPVYDAAGNIVPAEMGYLSFTFDHRVVDGAIGAAFGNEVIRRLKLPAAMLLD